MRACALLLLALPARAWLPHQLPRLLMRPPSRPGPSPLAIADFADADGVPVDSLPLPKPLGPVADADICKSTVGILLLNLGGPDTLENVEPFLYNLFSDPEIVTVPSFLQWANEPLAWLIARTRAPQSRQGYAAIGGGSPQLAITEAQGRAIEASLAKKGVPAKVYIAMRYWSPYTSDALAAVKQDGIQRVVVLPLYPQFSISTSGSSLRQLEREFYADQSLRQVRNIVIPSWYNRKGYVNAIAKLLAAKCDLFAEDPSRPHIFFSAHGLPTKYIEELADPYQRQTEATVGLVMARLRAMGYTNRHDLAYQSRVGPVKWMLPHTDALIPELANRGVRQLVVVPISFVNDHIEILEEIDIEYQQLARDSGIEWWERAPSLGLDADFIDDLADAVVEVLPRIEETPISDIDEGRPVALRVVNDLVQLRSKYEEIEYGPVRYEVRERRVGFNAKAELINGRIAMSALFAAMVWAYFDGSLTSAILDGRLPYASWLNFF